MSFFKGKRFKLVYYPEDQPVGSTTHTQPLYLATMFSTDTRTQNWTYYVSAGTSSEYRDYLWYLKTDDTLYAVNAGPLGGMYGLAAHHCF